MHTSDGDATPSVRLGKLVVPRQLIQLAVAGEDPLEETATANGECRIRREDSHRSHREILYHSDTTFTASSQGWEMVEVQT